MKTTWKLILSNLTTDSYITATQIGNKVLMSEKTVRNHLKDLSDYIEDYGAYIEAKHGYGYRFVITDADKYNSWYLNNVIKEKNNQIIPENSDERCYYIMNCLIYANDYVDENEFLDYLCISEKTFLNDCIKIKKILSKYDLKLTFKKDKGFCIVGDEYNKRVFIVNNINFLQCDTSCKDPDLVYITELLLCVLSKHDISMPELSIDNICKHLYLAVKRIHENQMLNEDYSFDIPNKEDGFLSFTMADELCEKLERKFNIKFSEAEKNNIVIHLLGHRVTERFEAGQSNVVITQEIHDLTTDILQFIYVTMKIDLRKNLRLIMNLAIHLVSLEVRIKYHITLKNPLLEDIKKKYTLGYTIAYQAKIYIDKQYDTCLSDDEIGYLALIFELSSKKESRLTKKNVLIVCATGKTSAELLAIQYRELFGSYLDVIKTCNISDLEEQNFKKYDYLLTTTPIHISVPIPILHVKLFMTDEEEIELKNKLAVNNENEIRKYFSTNLFFSHIDAKNKDEAIEKISSLIAKEIELPEDFAEKLKKRESLGSTDFGENIALAHPFGITTKSTFLAVGILENPVFWGNRNVSIVLVISVCNDNSQNLEGFYLYISKFMLNKSKVNKLLEKPIADNFLEIIEED